MSASAVEGEIVEEELVTGDEERKVRVYGSDNDDFVLTLPPNCRMTFGYFNPGQAQGDEFSGRRRAVEERRTALRIYGKGGSTNQLACFLGVRGFRDESIQLVKLNQRVIIETNLEDDGDGNLSFGGKQRKQLVAVPEPNSYN